MLASKGSMFMIDWREVQFPLRQTFTNRFAIINQEKHIDYLTCVGQNV